MQELRDDVRRGHEVCGVHRRRSEVVPELPGQHVAKQPFALVDVVQEWERVRRLDQQAQLFGVPQGPGRQRIVSGLHRGIDVPG